MKLHRGILALALVLAGAALLPAQQVPVRTPLRTIQVPSLRPGEAAVVSTVAVSPDRRWIAAAGDDHVVHIFDRVEARLVKTLVAHTDWIRAVRFTPDGRWLYSAGDDRRVIRWQVGTWAQAGQFMFPGKTVYALEMFPDGSAMALAGYDRRVHVYDMNHRPLAALEMTCDDVRAVAISPRGDLLAAAGRDGVVRMWSWPTRQMMLDHKGHRRRVRAMAFSPDGTRLATGGEGVAIALWNLAEGKPTIRLRSRPGRVMALVFLDNQRLASGGTDNQVRIWDLATGRPALRLVGHKGSVTSMVWLPRQQVLLSGSYDTSIRFWQLAPENAARLPGLR